MRKFAAVLFLCMLAPSDAAQSSFSINEAGLISLAVPVETQQGAAEIAFNRNIGGGLITVEFI